VWCQRSRQTAVGAMGAEDIENPRHTRSILRMPGDRVPVGGEDQTPAAGPEDPVGLRAEAGDVGDVFRYLG
jgi:hypothetical protein